MCYRLVGGLVPSDEGRSESFYVYLLNWVARGAAPHSIEPMLCIRI